MFVEYNKQRKGRQKLSRKISKINLVEDELADLKKLAIAEFEGVTISILLRIETHNFYLL